MRRSLYGYRQIGIDPHVAPRRETLFQRRVFSVWYQLEGDFDAAHAYLTQKGPEAGVKVPSVSTMRSWSRTFAWKIRSRSMDHTVEKKITDTDIEKKKHATMLHEEAGLLLLQKGMDYLKAGELDKGSDAVAAIKMGVDIHRQAIGLPAWAVEIGGLSDEELQLRYEAQMRKMAAETRIVDVQTPEEYARTKQPAYPTAGVPGPPDGDGTPETEGGGGGRLALSDGSGRDQEGAA